MPTSTWCRWWPIPFLPTSVLPTWLPVTSSQKTQMWFHSWPHSWRKTLIVVIRMRWDWHCIASHPSVHHTWLGTWSWMSFIYSVIHVSMSAKRRYCACTSYFCNTHSVFARPIPSWRKSCKMAVSTPTLMPRYVVRWCVFCVSWHDVTHQTSWAWPCPSTPSSPAYIATEHWLRLSKCLDILHHSSHDWVRS